LGALVGEVADLGLKSMPTETKNRTLKASCSGRELVAALWLSSDSFRTMPAKKAPSAKETPNSLAAPKASPKAIVSTARVKSSREPVRATSRSSQGSKRGPRNSARAMKPDTFRSVGASVVHRPWSGAP
jgi:hypothetical protein